MLLSKTMTVDNNGVLNIGGISVKDLVKNFDTPLLVLDEQEIRSNASEYMKSLQKHYPGDSEVLYASKAFSNRTLYRILEDELLSLDVVSGGELYTALQADFPPERIYFHGNNKLPEEINLALEHNIGGFFVDNFQEAELLNEMARERNQIVKAHIRLKPGISAHTHEYMVTGQNHSKFGVGIKNGRALSLIDKIENYENLELHGVHAHIGSQIYEKEAYEKLVKIMFSFLNEIREKKGVIISELNLGGGLGITQTENDPEISINKDIERLCNIVLEEINKNNYPLPKLMVEPGRSIVGTAGTTLYTIGMIKEINEDIKYVAIDGGMTDNIRPSLYNAEYEGFLANRADEKAVEQVTIAGKCCESGDILIKNLQLPEAENGDILAVSCTGAYTYALANNYNGIPRPAVVLVNEGNAEKIIARESYKDLLKRDIIPPGY